MPSGQAHVCVYQFVSPDHNPFHPPSSSLPPSLTDRPEEAEASYRRALSIKSDHINANTNMAHLCRLQGRWAESRRHYQVVLTRRPESPQVLYYLGLVAEKLGEPEDLKVIICPRVHLCVCLSVCTGHVSTLSVCPSVSVFTNVLCVCLVSVAARTSCLFVFLFVCTDACCWNKILFFGQLSPYTIL